MGWIQLSNNMIYQRMQKKTTLVKGLKNRNTKAESQELNFIGFTISVWRSTKLAEWGLPGKVSTAWLPPTGPPSPRIRGASQDPPNRRLLHISENPKQTSLINIHVATFALPFHPSSHLLQPEFCCILMMPDVWNIEELNLRGQQKALRLVATFGTWHLPFTPRPSPLLINFGNLQAVYLRYPSDWS